MNKTIKYGVFVLLIVAAVVYAVNLKFNQLRNTPPQGAQPQGTATQAIPGQEPVPGRSGSFFSLTEKEERLKGIDDNRISQDLEKSRKAEQDAIRADAEALKKADMEEKKAQLELEKIEKAKAAAAKDAGK